MLQLSAFKWLTTANDLVCICICIILCRSRLMICDVGHCVDIESLSHALLFSCSVGSLLGHRFSLASLISVCGATAWPKALGRNRGRGAVSNRSERESSCVPWRPGRKLKTSVKMMWRAFWGEMPLCSSPSERWCLVSQWLVKSHSFRMFSVYECLLIMKKSSNQSI